MRRMRSVAISVVCLVAFGSVAEAGGTFLAYPSKVKVTRGTTFETQEQAVAALSSDDNTLFTVEPSRKRGRFAAVYETTIPVPYVQKKLTWQFTGSAGNDTCTLKLALFNWAKGRFDNVLKTTIVTTEGLYTSNDVAGRRYTRNGKVRGRVVCASDTDFVELHSERLRLIGEDPP